MVDFKKLGSKSSKSPAINPRDIFQRLPRGKGINDLYASQADVLDFWFNNRTNRDMVLKLPTGGGKTLVGLLIAQSILNEKKEPVLYLAPTRQLVDQIVREGRKQGIPTVPYFGGEGADLPNDFLSAKSIGIATYQALFNGKSKFGIQGGQRDIVSLGGILLDDAHVAFEVIRESFTFTISKKENNSLYNELCVKFRNSFKEIDRIGIFEELTQGIDQGIIEVPYWDWLAKLDETREIIQPKAQIINPFAWPLIRDELRYCHALVSHRSFTVTPFLPLVDKFPTFEECQRRIFMSATITDDSEIIRTFNAGEESVSNPATSASLAGVGERMILVPAFMNLPESVSSTDFVKDLISDSKGKSRNIVILVPSNHASKQWESLSQIADSEKTQELIQKLQNEEILEPIVFINRYDGIDLKGDACRILVLDGLPKGVSDYDSFRSRSLRGTTNNSTLAQRIEQGIGRGARGAGDYCVVILHGDNLVAWLGRRGNLNFLTNSTRKQIEIGLEVSAEVSSKHEFINSAEQCLNQNSDWKDYYAQSIADAAMPTKPDNKRLQIAAKERKSFYFLRQGQFSTAKQHLNEIIGEDLDKSTKGWIYQLLARIEETATNETEAKKIQEKAFRLNSTLTRPRSEIQYELLKKPSPQAEEMVNRLEEFHCLPAYLSEFEQIASLLTNMASSNQFEEALKELGSILGFNSERPENEYGKGPDVLWRTNKDFDFIIEAKNRKKSGSILNKEDHGQILVAEEWFKSKYPDRNFKRVIVLPSTLATNNANAKSTYAFTLDELNKLITDIKKVLKEIITSGKKGQEAKYLCEQLLNNNSLTPILIVEKRLENFSPVSLQNTQD